MGRQRSHPVFIYMPRGRTSFSQPNQPVFARVLNEGTATIDSLEVAGRQFSYVGDFITDRRDTTHLREGFSIGTSWEPILLVRRKDTIDGTNTASGISVDLGELSWLLDQSVAVEARTAVVPSGSPDWQTPSRTEASDTALEVANTMDSGSALGVSDNGHKWGGDIAEGGDKNDPSAGDADAFKTPFPRRSIVALFARSLTGTATTADATAVHATLPEGW